MLFRLLTLLPVMSSTVIRSRDLGRPRCRDASFTADFAKNLHSCNQKYTAQDNYSWQYSEQKFGIYSHLLCGGTFTFWPYFTNCTFKHQPKAPPPLMSWKIASCKNIRFVCRNKETLMFLISSWNKKKICTFILFSPFYHCLRFDLCYLVVPSCFAIS